MNRVLNWRPSFKNLVEKFNPDLGLIIPTSVDLRSKCSPVEDQGQIGSCSGNAAAALMEFGDPSGNTRFSRLFIYYGERALEGSADADAGATTLHDACRVLHDKGVCSEDEWPYDPAKVFLMPDAEAFSHAAPFRIAGYKKLVTIHDMINCLAQGHPFMFGIPVYQSFMQSTDGHIPFPQIGEPLLGGHALACIGYDFRNSKFVFRNSWGESWGDGGYGYLPFEYMEYLADDFFVIRK